MVLGVNVAIYKYASPMECLGMVLVFTGLSALVEPNRLTGRRFKVHLSRAIGSWSSGDVCSDVCSEDTEAFIPKKEGPPDIP